MSLPLKIKFNCNTTYANEGEPAVAVNRGSEIPDWLVASTIEPATAEATIIVRS